MKLMGKTVFEGARNTLVCFLIAFGAPVIDAQVPASPLRTLDLAGDWRFLPNNSETLFADSTIDDSKWPLMRLPSNWFLQGSKAYPANADRGSASSGGPGDLWPIDPEGGLDWQGTVWFRRTFDWQPRDSTRSILDLDMVDYFADVFVNGVKAGHHEGYFQKWSLDITPLLRAGKNLIAVKVSAPELPFDMSARYPISWPKQQNQVKGIFLYHDTRPGATSARGQERSTGGILRGVALRDSYGLDLVGVNVTSLNVSEASARLVVQATVRNWRNDTARVALSGEIAAKNFQSYDTKHVAIAVVAPPGESRFRTEIKLDKPALWWSWDFGRPNLYQLASRLTPASDSTRTLDAATTVFGVRSITRDTAWVWRLNGKRIYPRGTNYIATQWLSQADRQWYARDVDMMIAANLNSVRVHAHIEQPEFYDVADSAGIMVWQDFPLQWGYTDQPAFHAEALRQARDMIDRFASHPSIIVWSMHNESPHAMFWMQKKDPQQNLALDNSLVALAQSLDSSRVLHRDSGTGDGHPYPGWYGGKVGDFTELPKEPFITEYGAQALPNLETMRVMLPASALTARDSSTRWNEWMFHDFQPPQTFGIAKLQEGLGLEDFIRESQRYQAQLTRFATEIFRRAKWKGSTGIYQFMFVDDWPSVTWAVVDYFRRAKPGYAALASSMQPVLPSIEYQIDNRDKPLALHIVNDLHTNFPGAALKWRVVSLDGKAGAATTRKLDIPADTAMKILDLGARPEITRGTSRLDAWIEDRNGRILGKTSLSQEDFR
ncbi:MAG TPA: glycoside hydrolase family 2 TIM barrel-domain containing protein [Gemmatimonadaceae bacterium]|nr:glycoside hydrolase family 2 TIM barrel-domain containing protein [Gemmatimonadaceae bacterium]